MTKADLKTGMFGVMSDGKKFVVVNDKIVYKQGTYDLLRTLNDDLSFPYYSIDVLVHTVSFNCMDEILKNREKDDTFILFDRNKKTETVMTIAEIEEKLGVKNLRIKGE